mgnify:CR=1 FL=1
MIQNKMKKITIEDLADNPIKRLACCLVLDTSHSMFGSPLEKLKKGIKLFLDTCLKDGRVNEKMQLSIITFGHPDFSVSIDEESRIPENGVKKILDFETDWREFDIPNFSADGYTPLGEAVELGLDLLLKQKQIYKETAGTYEQPWMVIMTDGKPYDFQSITKNCGSYLHGFNEHLIDKNPQSDYYGNKVKNSISDIAHKTSELVNEKKLNVISVAIGNDADPKIIKTFSPANKVLRLSNLNFSEFFKFFTATMADPSKEISDHLKDSDSVDLEDLF